MACNAVLIAVFSAPGSKGTGRRGQVLCCAGGPDAPLRFRLVSEFASLSRRAPS